MSLESFFEGLPIIGGIFGDSAKDISEDQQKMFSKLANQYKAQREPLRQARLNALRQSMGLFQPLNDLMYRQYGTKGFDYGDLLQDPMRDFESGVQQQQQQQEYQNIAEALNERAETLRRNPSIAAAVGSPQKPQLQPQYEGKVVFNEKTGKWEAKGG